MPFYEYQCKNCQYYTEVMQKITDAPLKKCPSCGRMTLVKLISAPVFRLKGSGWYETDFKSDQERKRNLAGSDREESKPAEAAKQSDAGSANAKSETKTEAKENGKSAPAPSAPAAKPPAKPATSTARKRAKPAARPRAGAAKPAARTRSKR